MGTRFICTAECCAHENYKHKIVRAHDRATIVTGTSLSHPVRTIKNRMSRSMARMEKEADLDEAELIAFGTGKLRLASEEGDVDNGSVMAGQISGLIDDVVPAAVVIQRVVAQAQEQIARLGQMVVG
jgi:enoyl-[acyl-carrier protein] reductase II